jgi:hypothetical protein
MLNRRKFMATVGAVAGGVVLSPALGHQRDLSGWASYPEIAPPVNFMFGEWDGAAQMWQANNCGLARACKVSPSGSILRLQLNALDRWTQDVLQGRTVERTMVGTVAAPNSGKYLPMMQDVWLAHSVKIEPGLPLSGFGLGSCWLVFSDVHSLVSGAATIPFQLQFDGGGWNECPPDVPGAYLSAQLHGTNYFPVDMNYVYTSPDLKTRSPFTHDMVTHLFMDPENTTGNGCCETWWNGEKVIDYRGPIGFDGDTPYPQLQIYRDNPNSLPHESLALQFANWQVVTDGDLASRISNPPVWPAP